VNGLSYCPKCGSKIDESMTFCSKCGASLKVAQTQTAASQGGSVTYRRRDEKSEKQEKGEKGGEKMEKREHPFIGALIGGIVILFLGVIWFLEVYGVIINSTEAWAVVFVTAGLLIILGAIYGSILAARRHPKTN
jgi:uncharacterized membrane protein YvbJ